MIQLDVLEALAVSRVQDHMRFVRNLKAGRALPLVIQRGRPGKNHNQYDARTVRYIDMQRVLGEVGNPEFGWCVRHFCDGESVNEIARACGSIPTIVEHSIRASAAKIADLMLERNLI